MHNIKKHLTKYLSLLLVFILVLSLSGCRESEVLQEIVYTFNSNEIDKDQKDMELDKNGKFDDKFNTVDADESEDIMNEEKKGNYNSNGTNADGSVKINWGNNNSKKNANNKPLNDTATNGKNNNGNKNASNNGNANNSDGSGNGGNSSSQPVNRPGKDVRTFKQVTDARGRVVDVPQDVNQVTAVSSAAAMVEMLGGSGRLTASNSDFINNDWTQTIIKDSFNTVGKWWDGDGTTQINSNNFTKLLSNSKIDVCFEISGDNTFTDAQVNQLEKYGVSYVVLYPMTSIQNLKNNIVLVAQVMGKNKTTGASSTSIANEYANWADSVINNTSSKTSSGDLTSVYISEWDDNATFQMRTALLIFATDSSYPNVPGTANGSGTGLAVTPVNERVQMFNAMMSSAHISTTNMKHDAVVNKDLGVYVCPMFESILTKTDVTGEYAYYKSSIPAYDNGLYRSIGSSNYKLGTTTFPAIVVTNSNVQSKIANNWFWNTFPNTGGGFFKYPDSNGKLVEYYSGVAGAYQIHISPTGIENWANGGVESPLESTWLAYKFYGSSVYNSDQLRTTVKRFYKKFFNTELTTDQMNRLMGIESYNTTITVSK